MFEEPSQPTHAPPLADPEDFLVLNPAPVVGDQTIVVLGVARGGTSLVAGVLQALGVFLGDKAFSPVYEDLRLSLAFEGKGEETVGAIVDEYNARFATWAWKRPGSLHYLDRVHDELRNPRYIVIFKDVFAVANRNRISMSSDLLAGLQGAVSDYLEILDFLQRHAAISLLVPFDRAISHKHAFVEAVIDHCALRPSQHERDRALAFITPNPRAYIEHSRADRVIGHLDVASTHEVRGWAAWAVPTRQSTPLQVELWVNDALVQTRAADDYRPDLIKARRHHTGHAGFRFELTDAASLRPGDTVRVLAGEERAELLGSPRVIV